MKAVNLFVLVLILGFISPLAHPFTAKDNDATNIAEKLVTVQRDILQKQRQIETARGRLGRLEAELREMELSIAESAKVLQHIEQELATLSRRQSELIQQKENKKQRLIDQQTQLSQQLRAHYITSRQDFLRLLLNQEDPQVLARMMIYYNYFHAARLQKIKEVTHLLQGFEQTVLALEQNLVRQQQQLERQATLHDALQQRMTQSAKLSDTLRTEIGRTDRQLSILRENENTLTELLRELERVLEDIPAEITQSVSFTQMRGKLTWPVDGAKRNRFGSLRQEDSDLKWQGVVIDAAEGSPVRAIHQGRVAFAQWMQGFGLLIILDHGEGYMSLYAHNRSLQQEAGEWVQAGDVIAYTGNSGGLVLPGLYFEIRRQGRPVDPELWCVRG